MPQIITAPPPSSGGGTGGPETDPIATVQLATHKTAVDPHGDRTHSDGADAAHVGAVDPHGDRQHSDTALTAHTGGADPHGAHAYTDSRIATVVGASPAALDTLAEIDAQMQSDETGAAAMQAAINARALQADLVAHEGAAPAHAAGAVSVNPAGLVIVTGTDVQAALAELDAWTQTRKFSTLGDVNVAGIADGQLPAWNAAAQKYLPTNPTGSSEVAYSENGTGVVTGPVAGVNGNFGVAVAIPNTDIIVPPSNGRPVYLDGWVFGQQTTIGAGLALLEIWETTGAPVLLDRTQGVQLPNNIAGNSLRNVGVYHQPLRIGPVAAQRSFQLRINTFGNGSTPAWQVPNTNAVGFKPWLRAMAG